MKVVKQIEVYLVSKKNTRPIDIVQYDTGIQLVFNVKDFEIPSGTTGTLYVQKPSGKFVYQEKGITVSDNTITIDLENQAITEHGKVPYQITLTNGSDEITTFEGLMMVQRSLKDAGATESTTVIRAFDEAVSERVASFRAQAETIASAVIATIPEDYTVMEAKVNELANAIKGHLTGEIVVASDVSPVGHEMNVKVHGKNLFDVAKITDATNITNNGDGSISVTSSSTNFSASTGKTLKELAPALVAGKTYILKATSDVTENVRKKMYLSHSEGNHSWMFGTTLEVNEINLESIVYFYADNNETITTISSIQIEEGTKATEYEPYIDPTTVTFRRCGKNLASAIQSRIQVNGLTVEPNIDGTFTISGSISGTNPQGILYITPSAMDLRLKAGQKYKMSLYKDGVPFSRMIGSRVVYEDSGTIVWNTLGDYEKERILNYAYLFHNDLPVGDTSLCGVYEFQIEVGETATEFEAYASKTYTPASDGTVEGVTSLSPNMTLLTDTENVIVECEYTKDTNKVIQKICDALGIEI